MDISELQAVPGPKAPQIRGVQVYFKLVDIALIVYEIIKYTNYLLTLPYSANVNLTGEILLF